MRILLIATLWVLTTLAAGAQVMTFNDPAQEQAFRQLTTQLRCPKCQNNSIADSNAMIAVDLRQKVYELLQEGKSKQQITDYMVARYGHFVTYDPPLTPLTLWLWVLPVLTVTGGGWFIVARTRRSGGDRAIGAAVAVAAPGPEPATPGTRGSRWLFVPGIAVALVVTLVSYMLTGGHGPVREWQQATAQAPALLERALDPRAQPLNEPDLRRLALGLRTRLQQDQTNTEAWVMLGRVGMALGNASMATGAYGRAYGLAPADREVLLGYSEALIRSSDPDDNRHGAALLRQAVAQGTTSIRLLSAYAFSAFEQQRFDEAISAWRTMLTLLPAGDTRRGVIERSIDQARSQLPGGEK